MGSVEETIDSVVDAATVADAPKQRLKSTMVAQFVKFGIVGVGNTLLSLAVYAVLLKGFDVWYIAASAIGYAVGMVNGFLWNRRWTFRGHVGDALTPVRWCVVQGCGLAANLGLVFMFVHDAGLDKLLGQACATAIVVVFTFIANRAWTFRMHPAGEPGV
ncbi:MAG TPA: GtrA family protein [Solirubrobacteraceae bacterium]|jgi:putative flippase GtrA|nr:GtrA family protein [Solirubrobacteraceae bacterium]